MCDPILSWQLDEPTAGAVYRAMAPVFVARADAAAIRNEIRLCNAVPELPDLAEANA